jgi:hypothetical protein
MFWHDTKDAFSNSIYFLSANETRDLISSNSDGYFNRFTKNDLTARNAVGLEQYIQGFNCSDFSDSDKDLISDCIAEIETIVIKDPYVDWVDSEKFHAIPWKIGLITDDSYEYGLPHTRIDAIFLPKKSVSQTAKDLINTLMHEKLHVYQKMYPDDFQKYLDHHGFVKYGNGGLDLAANPDTDDYVYAVKKVVHCGKYAKGHKPGINSIVYQPINDPKYDHPRELAVYNLLENLL